MIAAAHPSRMEPRDRRAILIGAAIVALGLTWAFVLRPTLSTMRDEREQLETQRKLLARELGVVAAAPALARARTQARYALDSLRARMFAGDSVSATAALTSYVSDVAAGAGVRLASVDARAPSTSHGVTRVAADIRGEATWRQAMAFVRILETAGLLVDIEELRIERGPRGGPLRGDLVNLSATLAGHAATAAEDP